MHGNSLLIVNEQLESKTYSLNLGYDFKGHAQTEMLITSTGSSLKRPKFHLTRKRRPAFYVTKNTFKTSKSVHESNS